MQAKMEQLKTRLYNFLRWSEKYTKTDMVYLAHGGWWLSLGKGVGILAGLALSVAYANLLPPDVFGNYQFILSLAAIITAFSLSGMGTAITRGVAQGSEGVLRIGVLTHLKWSFGIIAVALAGSAYYFINDNITLSLSLLIVAVFSPFFESFKLYNAFLDGKKDFRTKTLFGFIRTFADVGALLIVMYLTKDPVLLVLTHFGVQALITIVLYIATLFKYQPKQTGAGETISYGKHLSAMNVVGKVAGNIDKILIFHFLGAAQVAIYTFALALPRRIRGTGKILQTLVLPKMSQRSLSELRYSLPRRVGILFAPVIALAALYIFTAPYIFQFLFPQYEESVLFSQVFALTLLFIPLSILQQTLVAHMKKRQLYVLKIGIPIIKIVLLTVLLPFYGIWGGVIALLASQSINAAAVLFFFTRLKV